MRKEDYAEIKDAVERAGYFTSFHPYEYDKDVGWFLVLVTHCTEGKLHGNSFRLLNEQGQWRLITWLPAEYLVPADTDLAALCLECLRASAAPIYVVPPELVARYHLIELPETEGDVL